MDVGIINSRDGDKYDESSFDDLSHQTNASRNEVDCKRNYSNKNFDRNSNNTCETQVGERYKILRISNTSTCNNTYFINTNEPSVESTSRGSDERKWLVASASQCHVTLQSDKKSCVVHRSESNRSSSNSPKYSIQSSGNSVTSNENECEQGNMEFKVVLKREARNISSPIMYKKLKWQCTFCGEYQATRLSLITHIKSHMMTYCKVCLKVMSSKEQLQNHMESKHYSSSCNGEDQPDTQFVTSKYGRRRRVFSTSALLPKRKYDVKK